MRINIHVPENHAVALSSIQLDEMPAPLVRLAPSNELVLIELQGSLEIDNADPTGGQVLARLEFHPGREDQPTLLVSHHRLEGKLVSLMKPMAVLELKNRAESASHQGQHPAQRADGSADIPSSPSRFVSEQTPRVRIDETDENTPASPTLMRKRGRGDEEQNSTSAAKRVPSSSPLVQSRMPGSEADFSSPLPASKRRAKNPQQRASKLGSDTGAHDGDDESDDENDAWLHRSETATYMEVVCIIRKKLLFSKRPEPVVRLDADGGQEEEKAALGVK